MSQTDIDPGKRWNRKLDNQLRKTQFGIICLTKGNLNAPWVLFESGALAKTIGNTSVCPYLINLEPSQIPIGPLIQFQATRANEEGTWKLIRAINKALKDDALSSDKLRTAFKRWWPDLESVLSSLPDEDITEEQERINRAAVFGDFMKIGMDSAFGRLAHEDLQKYLQGARCIKVLKTWFPESAVIERGLSTAIKRGARVRLLLCKPGSLLLEQRSVGAHRDASKGATTVYRAVENVHSLVQATPDANVKIACYDSWPGCPVIWYDDTTLMGFYLRGAPSPEWPWVGVKEGTPLAEALDDQYTELLNLPDTERLDTAQEMASWLRENRKWGTSKPHSARLSKPKPNAESV